MITVHSTSPININKNNKIDFHVPNIIHEQKKCFCHVRAIRRLADSMINLFFQKMHGFMTQANNSYVAKIQVLDHAGCKA